MGGLRPETKRSSLIINFSSSPSSGFSFIGKTAITILVNIIFGPYLGSQAKVVEINTRGLGYVISQSQNIDYLALYRNSLPMPTLESRGATDMVVITEMDGFSIGK